MFISGICVYCLVVDTAMAIWSVNIASVGMADRTKECKGKQIMHGSYQVCVMCLS